MGCKMSSRIFEVKLSEQEVQFYKKFTSCSTKDVHELHKNFRSNTGNGKMMSKDQFQNVYKMFFASEEASKENCDHVFRTFDTDENGYISFNEFLFAMCLFTNGTPEQKLSFLFHMFDVNRDGVIAVDELTLIIESIYKLLINDTVPLARQYIDSPTKQSATIFQKLDKNRDGKITMSEFVSGCCEDKRLLTLLTSNTSTLKMTRKDYDICSICSIYRLLPY